MSYSPLLPAGLVARPASMADLQATVDLFNVCSQRLLGRRSIDADYLRNEWSAPAFNLETDSRCIWSEDGDLIAYGELWASAPYAVLWGWGRVHPDQRQRGLGTFLLEWEEQRARELIAQAQAGTRVTLRNNARDKETDSQALLSKRGYTVVRHFHKMIIDLPEEREQVPVSGGAEFPAGITVRAFDRTNDLPDLIRADTDAFRDHWGFVERPFAVQLEDWSQMIDDDPKFDPTVWYLAMDGEEIAGFCLCNTQTIEDPNMGWVRMLGVRRPWRRRGLATALLHQAFYEFRRRGRRRVGLGVDAASLTGATRLYEKVGMHVDSVNLTYEKELRPGTDLSTQTVAEVAGPDGED